VFQRLIEWLESHQKSCVFHSNGIVCPGCGLQTAVILLLKGDFLGSIAAYPALIPVILTIIWTFVYFLVYKLKKGAKIFHFLIIIDFILIIGNWVLKIM